MVKVAPRLKALKSELSELGIKNAQVTSLPALAAKKLEALEKKYKCRLPDEIRDYYLQTNGQTISWSTAEGLAVARSRVLNVQAFLDSRPSAGSRKATAYYSRYLGEAEKQALARYWVFEWLYADSFILVPADAEAGDVPVFLLQYPYQLTKLDLKFPGYVEQLLENKALLNWQEAHKEKDQDPELVASFERALEHTRSLSRKTHPPAEKPSAYQQKLDELVKRVKSNKKLELVTLQTYPAPPVNAFKKIEVTFKRKLPQSMIDFYTQVNGFKLLWRTQPDVAPAAAGAIDILPLEQAFGGEHHGTMIDWDDQVTYQVLWTDEQKESAPADFNALQNKRVFDRHLSRNQVVMELAPEGVEFFYFIDGGLVKLDATFEDVIELVFSSGGVEYYPDLLRSDASDAQFVRDFEDKARLLNPEFRAPVRPR